MSAPSAPPPLWGIGLAVLLGSVALGSAFGSAGETVWPAVLLAWATALLLGSLVLLGGSRLAAGVVALSVGGGITLALLAASPSPGDDLWGGLPAGAAILIYGVGLLPALLVPFVYAWTFTRSTLSREDLERVRRAKDPQSPR